jgi:hypothetical protein
MQLLIHNIIDIEAFDNEAYMYVCIPRRKIDVINVAKVCNI